MVSLFVGAPQADNVITSNKHVIVRFEIIFIFSFRVDYDYTWVEQ